MISESPRSRAGSHLRVRAYSRLPVWLRGAALVGVAAFALHDVAADSPPSDLESAEVEPFRYSPPAEDLLLDEDGEQKREALLLYYRGISLEESDMQAALDFFKRVIELDPANVVLAMETATHCAVNGRFSEALSLLEESLSENAEDRDAYLNLARYCDAHHNDDAELKSRALDYAQEAVEKFPTDYVVIEFLARILVERGESERAEKLLEESLEREVEGSAYWLALGNVARDVWPIRDAENRDRVIGIFTKALRAAPEDPETIEDVANFLQLAGATDQAIRLYQALVERAPDRLSARGDLAELYWQSGQTAAAIAGLEALVQIDPENLQVRRQLVQMSLATEDFDRALAHCEAIVGTGDGEVDDYLRLSVVQQMKDRPGGALRTLREAASNFPESPELSYSLGRLYLSLDRYAEAYGALEMAEGQAEVGEAGFLTEGFYFDYAVCAERLGELGRAADLFRRSIELVPDEAKEEKAKSLNYLGFMWLEQEMNIDEAGELIREANDLKPDNIAYLDSLGWFHFLKGDHDDAIKFLKRAEELMEEGEPDSEILEHLAHAFAAKGERDMAKRYAARALSLDPESESLKALLTSIEKAS